MKIRAVKLRITTSRGEFGFKFEFSRGLTVIRGSNSSGKSTFYNTLVYGLGMEELIGGKGEKMLPYAVKEYFLQGDSRIIVERSEVLVELENLSGRSVTLRRAIRDSARQSKLMEVFEGAHLTEGIELSIPMPTYLFLILVVLKSKRDISSFSKSLWGINCLKFPPQMVVWPSSIYRRYLLLFIVEQKRGWTDYIANIPFFGIRDARIRVTEFLLGLGVFERQAKRAELDRDSVSIDSDWRKTYDTLRQAAAANNIVIEGLSATPVPMFDPETVLLMKSDGRD